MEGAADGLSLRLLRGLCDKLSFQNLGRDEWELVIQEELDSGRLLSLLVATSDGRIVGHQAVGLFNWDFKHFFFNYRIRQQFIFSKNPIFFFAQI